MKFTVQPENQRKKVTDLKFHDKIYGMKKILLTILTVFLTVALPAQSSKQKIKDGAILHCFCWSFKTIEEKLPEIAAAGYTAVQCSPINTCLVGDYGGLDYLGADLTGKWYFHYQPTDWKIGNYQLGTRDEFISMCAKAEEYGIGVIVDVLPNHTTPRKKEIKQDFIDAVGGLENLYHDGEKRGITNYGDRLQCTTYSMGGLPDVNTENPDFQEYFMKYMNDVIDCGADGFRFDTAKHIGLPDDPKDPRSKENDFWPIFTGRKPIRGVSLKRADELFMYGEVLQGGGAREDAYGEFLSVVASNYGGVLRGDARNHKFLASGLKDFRNDAGGDKLVTWLESHDTYANQGESAGLTNFEIRSGWAVIGARKQGTPLFLSRPKGPEGVQFPNVGHIGDAGNDEFKHPEVVAVNLFRREMVGEDEDIFNGADSSVLVIKRGNRGFVAMNVGTKATKLDFEINLPDGTYQDKAHGIKYKVAGGKLTGKLPKRTIVVVY